MLLVTTAAMLAIWVLALVETKNTAAADSPPQNGKIAFTRHQSHQSGVGYNIYTVNPDGSNLSRLINNNETTYLPQPAWSPDGTKIAFPYGDPKVGVGPNDSIGVMDTNGSNLRVLTPNLWYVSHSNLAWSPDGKKLAFKGKINELGESLFDIYTMDIEGSSTTNITNTPQIQESSIDFSPDGSQMCLQRDYAPETGQEGFEKEGLYVMNVDTSDPTLLTDLHGVECVWSPDGTKIAYDLWDHRPAGHPVDDHEVYVMNAEGSHPMGRGLLSRAIETVTPIFTLWTPTARM
jgi:Tol biopolymer transport system component